MPLITVKGLNKAYPGLKAINDLDMEIESGQIVGLLGPNTSGKTTLLKLLAGLLHPDSGTIQYPNGAAGALAQKSTVSLLPDRMTFPSWMKVSDAFHFYQDMYPDFSAERAKILSELLELVQNKTINRMSKGMQERVALALTFSRQTSLYLLDEPLGGIDPLGKVRVLESILSMELGTSSILLSTHLVKDVETIFDSILLLHQGQIIYKGDCEMIREEQGKTVEQVYVEVFTRV